MMKNVNECFDGKISIFDDEQGHFELMIFERGILQKFEISQEKASQLSVAWGLTILKGVPF